MKSNGREYDYYAPPGSLGIVVASTSKGPIVHSISRTSPLLGVVGKGDYIIWLDDVDTRRMTAVKLACLLAKRKERPQRKLTLLSCGGRTAY
eukprot:9489263-Ditylum_brightwellii.AAC.1